MKMEKCCSSCKELKNITHFSPRKVSKDGYNCRCKICIYEYHKIYRKRNKAKEKAKEYNLKNQEKIHNQTNFRSLEKLKAEQSRIHEIIHKFNILEESL